jgi:hypothetical protein
LTLKKLCVQLIVIYTQVILQLAVYTSCTHKFCANQTYA